jgi:hypothetical protein
MHGLGAERATTIRNEGAAMPTPDKERDQNQRQSQEQRQSGTRQDQSQKQDDKDRTSIEDENSPDGRDPSRDESKTDELLQEDVERAKRQRDQKPGTDRDPAGISPQDDLA